MMSSLLTDAGAGAGALFAIGLLLVTVVRGRPVRWVWRRLVGEPATVWLRSEIERGVEGAAAPLREELRSVHDQLRPNGGHSLRDRVNLVEALIREQGSGS